MNKMRIGNQGHFASEFLLTMDDRTLSLGDYIEVILLDAPYFTGEEFEGYKGRPQPVVALHLNVVFSCLTEPVECVVRGPLSFSMRHWIKCLDIGVTSTVVGVRYTHRNHVWYMPEIDSKLPTVGQTL